MGCLEVTTFNDHHVGHECHPLASKFVSTLQKLQQENTGLLLKKIHDG